MELFWTIFDKTDQKDNLSHAELFWTKHAKPELHRARPIKANKYQIGTRPILLYRTKMYQSGSYTNYCNHMGSYKLKQDQSGLIGTIKDQSGP